MQKRSTDGTAIPGNCQSCDHRQKRQLRQINELSFEPERGRIGRLLLLLFNNFSVFLFHFFEAAHFNLLSHLLLKEERKEGGASTPTRWWMMSMASPPPRPPPRKKLPQQTKPWIASSFSLHKTLAWIIFIISVGFSKHTKNTSLFWCRWSVY